jgi:uncharacterized membrane protein
MPDEDVLAAIKPMTTWALILKIIALACVIVSVQFAVRCKVFDAVLWWAIAATIMVASLATGMMLVTAGLNIIVKTLKERAGK